MSTLSGLYFDGISASGQAVKISRLGDNLTIAGENIEITVPLNQVKLSPRLGRTRRKISFANEAVCELDDDPLLDKWFRETIYLRLNLLAKLETHWVMVLSSVLLIFGLTTSLALWGLPWAAQKIAPTLPQEWVDQLANEALIAMDKTLGNISNLTASRQHDLRKRFESLASEANIKARFEFRNWPRLGPNALALPDGTIVMTDDLVALAEDDRELIAVIAHELGHVHERHALQKIIASSGLAALIFILTGDVSGLSNIVIAAPTIILHLQHSRDLENAADQYGFTLLSQEHIEPVWFARMVRKLGAERRVKNLKNTDGGNNWLRTHPDSEQRALRAEQYGAAN